MRFLSLIKVDESLRDVQPPPELFEAMGRLIEETSKDGTLLDTGGLHPTSAGVRVTLRDGEISVVDGPFAEGREVVGGWAFMQARSRTEAVEQARRFMQIHLDNWPGFEGTLEVRQVEDGTEHGGGAA
ncbi:YciI family protein [soil metagenome]